MSNRYPTFTEYFNQVKWDASPTFRVTTYRIYKNNVLMTSFDAISTNEYRDRRQKKGSSFTYAVSVVNYLNNESSKVFVTIP